MKNINLQDTPELLANKLNIKDFTKKDELPFILEHTSVRLFKKNLYQGFIKPLALIATPYSPKESLIFRMCNNCIYRHQESTR